MIAALYVEKGGVYYGLPDVDPCGHPYKKPTWLYAFGVELPALSLGSRPWPCTSRPESDDERDGA